MLHEITQQFLSEVKNISGSGKGKSQKFDFVQHFPSSASSLSLSMFQYLYLDQNFLISGTSDLSIFEKEKESLKSPFLIINNLP